MPSGNRTGMALGRERRVAGSELKHSQLSTVSVGGQESWDSSLEAKGMITTHSQPLALKHLFP